LAILLTILVGYTLHRVLQMMSPPLVVICEISFY